MTSVPETRYARTDDGLHIAYQVVGDGPIDVAFVPWWWNHLEHQWDDPLVSAFLERLASFARLILFDQRGVGLSDPVPLNNLPTIEQWMDDVRVVLDAVGSARAALVAHGDGGLVALPFAATHPERVSALVLIDSYARIASDEGYEGVEQERLDEILAGIGETWGTGAMVEMVAPSRVADEEFRRRLALIERISLSPGAAGAMQLTIGRVDVRSALPTIAAPTLVINHIDNRYVLPSWSEYLAAHISDSRLVRLPGSDHLYWIGDASALVSEIEEFLTGARAEKHPERVLATVLFTDIVASTDHVVQAGDASWREVLTLHDAAVRRQLERHHGREIKTMGDGFLATFDGPTRAIKCGLAVIDVARRLGLDVRAGLHTGEIEIRGDDIAGLTVHIAQRVCALARPGEALVSRTVTDLLAGSGLQFADRGEYDLKGVPGTWRLFGVLPV